MTLSVSLGVAQSGLGVASDLSTIVSRNVANQGVAGASRKTANVVTVAGGGARIVSISRAANMALQASMLSANSDASSESAIVAALNQLNQTTGDPQSDTSPAAYVQQLTNALQQYAADPSDQPTADAAVAAADNLANALNQASQTTQTVRQQADAAMGNDVTTLNNLLGQFQTLNQQVVAGTKTGADVTDLQDQRDAVLASISQYVGVKTVTGANNDMAIYTDSGVTLFDENASNITFQPTAAFDASTTGNAVYADGVPIVGGSGTMTVSSGELAGLAQVRDQIATTYQSQLDEISRGLIQTFSEQDQNNPPTLPTVTGLFTYPGAPAMPVSGTVMAGLAATIKVSAAVDPSQGGNASLLRDGGISGNPAYVYNSSGAAGFSDRLNQLVDAMNAAQPFDPSAQAGSSGTIESYATSSISWLQGTRSTASSSADYKNTVYQQASTALSSATGVNLDQEMTNLLAVERSYQASSKLISTINDMFQSLINVVQFPA
jgi:flagellar hook-associated protein 1